MTKSNKIPPIAANAKKVLMLHGYAQSAKIFSKRTAAVRKFCAPEIELVFPDGPHILQPVDLAFGDPLESLDDTGAASTDPEAAFRAWGFKPTPDDPEPGLVEALEVIKDALSKDTYAGVFGFSQGGGMAATIAALVDRIKFYHNVVAHLSHQLEKPYLYPPFIVDGEPIHPPLEFCVSVAGYRPSGPIRTPLFTPSYSTPTLHVLGRTDVVVIEERSNQLIEVSSNQRVEYHPGGHFVPSQKPWRYFFKAWMLDPNADIQSPTSLVAGDI